MYESLNEFSNIIVSGPQRSGTRITAKIIAEDTGKNYIDEKEINFHDIRLLNYYLAIGNNVIQCPALCHLVHQICVKNNLVIIVRRNIDEIINSERRCWDKESMFTELYKYGYSNGIISKIKYEYWENVQNPILGDNGREISYNNLSSHKLFISKRDHFKWDQTL